MAGRRLAHIRTLGEGPAGWNDPVWGLAGYDPSVSVYDAPSEVKASGLNRAYSGGAYSTVDLAPPSEPTSTRAARVSALQSSLPASRFFGGYVSAGTGRSWSPQAVAYTQFTPLSQNFNPHMAGAAELWPATTYSPYPSPGALYPKAV